MPGDSVQWPDKRAYGKPGDGLIAVDKSQLLASVVTVQTVMLSTSFPIYHAHSRPRRTNCQTRSPYVQYYDNTHIHINTCIYATTLHNIHITYLYGIITMLVLLNYYYRLSSVLD